MFVARDLVWSICVVLTVLKTLKLILVDLIE